MARKKPHCLQAPGAKGYEDYKGHNVNEQDETGGTDLIFKPTGAMSNKAKFDDVFEQTKARITAVDFVWPEYEELFEDTYRQRAWWFILYPESMNPDTFSILSEKGIQAAVSPLHDRDYWPDGTKKKAHFHVIVYTPGKLSTKQLTALMDLLGGVMLEPVANIVGACRYLAHLDIQPDRIEADRGKVRYSVDDIVCFNGFDVMSYIKATQTQIAQALKELYGLIEELNITAYWNFVKYVYETKPEYEFVMANPHVCNQLDRAIRSRYAIAHKDDEVIVQQSIIEEQRDQIKWLMGGMQRVMELLDNASIIPAANGGDSNG